MWPIKALTKHEQFKMNRGVPIDKKQSAYVTDLFANAPPPIDARVRQASRQLKSEFQRLHRSTPFLKQTDLATALKVLSANRRATVCRAYWRTKWNAERPSMVDVKPYAKQMEISLSNLLSQWEQLPKYVQVALYELRPETAGEESFEGHLKSMRDACYEASYFDGEPGRKKSFHHHALVADIAAIWTEITKRPVPKTLGLPFKGASEFISPAPQFILSMCKSVDGDINLAVVRNGIRNLLEVTEC